MQTLVAVVDGVMLDRKRRSPRPYTHAAVFKCPGSSWDVLGFSLSATNAQVMILRSRRWDKMLVEYRVVPLLRLVRGELLPLEEDPEIANAKAVGFLPGGDR